MAVIWKYPMRITDKQTLDLPKGAIFLEVDPLFEYKTNDINPEQWSQLEAWFYLPDERVKSERRTFHIYGTGQTISHDQDALIHLRTFRNPPFVWHLYEALR